MELRNKRLQKELSTILKANLRDICVDIKDENIAIWTVAMKGPVNTPYEGGLFEVICTFPDNYPFGAPDILFSTAIFHPNISNNGKVCLSIFQGEWSGSITMQRVLLSILSLLASPNVDDPLVPEVANLYKKDYGEYVRLAKKHTIKYAVKNEGKI